MQVSIVCAAICLGLSLAAWPRSGPAQSGQDRASQNRADRDYIFTDEHGHLVLRFVGTGTTGLDESQIYEVENAELSQMVHDRLHADLQFDVEPRDADWAALMQPQIEQQMRHAGPEFSDIMVECRAHSCRAILEQPVHWDGPEHQEAVLNTIQASFEDFIAAREPQFEPVFLITAYYQVDETSHIKAFIRRSATATQEQPSGR